MLVSKTTWNFDEGFLLLEFLLESPVSSLLKRDYSEDSETRLKKIQTILMREGITSHIYNVFTESKIIHRLNHTKSPKTLKIGSVIDCGGAIWSLMGIDGIKKLLAFHELPEDTPLKFKEIRINKEELEIKKESQHLERITCDFDDILFTTIECNPMATGHTSRRERLYLASEEMVNIPKRDEFLTGTLHPLEWAQLKFITQTQHELPFVTPEQIEQSKNLTYSLINIAGNVSQELLSLAPDFCSYLKKKTNELSEQIKIQVDSKEEKKQFIIKKHNTSGLDYSEKHYVLNIDITNKEKQFNLLNYLGFKLTLEFMARIYLYHTLPESKNRNLSYFGEEFLVSSSIYNPKYKKQILKKIMTEDNWKNFFKTIRREHQIKKDNDWITLMEHPQITDFFKKKDELKLRKKVKPNIPIMKNKRF